MFTWNDYLSLAERLATLPEEEYKRTAISRAYYAAFCSASAWYLKRWKKLPKPRNPKEHLGSHEIVWAAYQLPRHAKDRRYGKVGSLGDSLKQLRVYADYKESFPMVDLLTLDDQVQIALRLARLLVKNLNGIESGRSR